MVDIDEVRRIQRRVNTLLRDRDAIRRMLEQAFPVATPLCITLERHTMTSEVTVWLELSGLDFVKPALWDERQLMITAFVERLMHASLTHQAHGSFTGTMQEEAFTQLCRDLSQTIAH
mgnify:CR=1 FL=1